MASFVYVSLRAGAPDGPTPSLARNLASLASPVDLFAGVKPARGDLKKTLDYELPCLDRLQQFQMQTSAKLLRLRGAACAPSQRLNDSSIVNRTNGFVATVFQTRGHEFTTDYVYLTQGENRVMLNVRSHTGDTWAQELVISRQ